MLIYAFMKFDIITIFPKIFDSYLNESILKRAQKDEKIKKELEKSVRIRLLAVLSLKMKELSGLAIMKNLGEITPKLMQ